MGKNGARVRKEGPPLSDGTVDASVIQFPQCYVRGLASRPPARTGTLYIYCSYRAAAELAVYATLLQTITVLPKL